MFQVIFHPVSALSNSAYPDFGLPEFSREPRTSVSVSYTHKQITFTFISYSSLPFGSPFFISNGLCDLRSAIVDFVSLFENSIAND